MLWICIYLFCHSNYDHLVLSRNCLYLTEWAGRYTRDKNDLFHRLDYKHCQKIKGRKIHVTHPRKVFCFKKANNKLELEYAMLQYHVFMAVAIEMIGAANFT